MDKDNQLIKIGAISLIRLIVDGRTHDQEK